MEDPPNNWLVFRGGPLSNFAASPFVRPDLFTDEPREYRTVEHYFQAAKARDARDHALIAEQPSPGDATP